jgi:hypothetical protein
LGEYSDKGLPAQDLRPNIHPIYQKSWAEGHRIELSAQFSGGEGSTQFPMPGFFS